MANLADAIIFLVTLVANLALGLYFAFFRRGQGTVTTSELFLGSHSLRMLPLALSTMASTISGVGFIAFTGYFYAHGLHLLWCVPSFLMMLPFLIQLFVPLLYNLKVTSVFQVS